MKPATGFILWFLKASNAWAVTTPWRAIYCLPEQQNNEALWTHEKVHLEQIERDGAFMWTLKVFWYLIRYGYKNSPYEIEARKVAGL